MLSPDDHQHGTHMGLSAPNFKSRKVPAGHEHDIPSSLGVISNPGVSMHFRQAPVT
jgi:hypothetical protein